MDEDLFQKRNWGGSTFITGVHGHQKELLVDLKLYDKLYDRVIELFVGKERRDGL